MKAMERKGENKGEKEEEENQREKEEEHNQREKEMWKRKAITKLY